MRLSSLDGTVVLGVERGWMGVGGGTDPTPAAPRFIPAFF